MTVKSNDAFFSSAPEAAYAIQPARAKALGQFFTPYPIARFMAQWVAAAQPQTVLDPAVGLGVLLRAVRQAAGPSVALRGYDIDSTVLKQARTLWQADSIDLQKCDYLNTTWEDRYDGIIANPPYLHFRSYKNRASLLKTFSQRLGLKLGGQTNLHTLFLLKSLYQLSPKGRAAYILPPELLNADYGVAIKQYLLADGSLKHILVFNAKDGLFEGALTTSCILLFDKANLEPALTFHQVGSLDELGSALESNAGRRIAYADLDPALKWRTYYQAPQRTHTANLVPLSTYGQVSRGIATGHNGFFAINEARRKQFGMSHQQVLPCLTRANQATDSFFTQDQWEALRAAGKPVYLVNLGSASGAAAQKYIAWGEGQGAHQRYLTRHRQPWYQLEQRPPAPIWVTVFNRKGLRFIRNEAGVRNLTCFHGLYLNETGEKYLDLLMAYLLTPVARAIFKENGREYGEGLEKFEPNDLNNALLLDLAHIPVAQQKAIVKTYQAYRASALAGQPDENLVLDLDQRFTKLLG